MKKLILVMVIAVGLTTVIAADEPAGDGAVDPARSALEMRYVELATQSANLMPDAQLRKAVAEMEQQQDELLAAQALNRIVSLLEKLREEYPETGASRAAEHMLQWRSAADPPQRLIEVPPRSISPGKRSGGLPSTLSELPPSGRPGVVPQ